MRDMGVKLIQESFAAHRPCGYSCPPDGNVITPEGMITDICFLLDDGPEDHGVGWLERNEDRSISIKTNPPQIKWAYRIQKRDGEVEIVGDMQLWVIWKSLLNESP